MADRRILFVDDDPLILDGLRDLLRRERHRWDMVFAAGGAAALVELEGAAFDAVVADMCMPGVDGAALLQKVREAQPRAARIVLSGHAERELALRAIPVAQQFIGKPCDPDLVRSILERTFRLQDRVGDASIRDVVGKIQTLPALPSLYYDITHALSSAENSMADIAAIVERDQAMTTKVLQIANSAYFGFSHEIASAKEAITYLGVDMLKDLVLSAQIFRPMDAATARNLDLPRFERFAFLTARVARRLLGRRRNAPEAFTAALLHDVGHIVLAQHLTGRHTSVQQAAAATSRPLHIVEKEMLGITHAEIGAYLLGLWGLPQVLVEAAAFHHDLSHAGGPGCEVLAAVHVADVLVDATCFAGAGMNADLYLDVAFLERAGLADLLPAWRREAEEELALALQ